jgi:holo-[acyl-carrier protein] synthase
MILGLGLDIARVDRIQETLDRFGRRFMDRIFTPYEQEICLARFRPASAFAMRFAAKEAFSKAVGLGMQGLAWREIEVRHDPRGKPYLVLSGRAKKAAERLGATSSFLSLTDEAGLGAAVVVLEGNGSQE